MARIAAGQVVFVSNEDTDEAIPVKLVGGVEVELGANVGILNIANVVIDPSTEGKQDDGITILTTIDTAQDLTNTKLTAIDLDTSKIPSLGTAAMAASAPATIATNDTQFGAVGAAADPDGNVHGQLRSIAENTDTLEELLAVGTGAMASAQAVTIATDDTMITALDAAVDLTNDRIGATGDAAVAAGATGTLSAKMRRVTTDLAAVNTNLTTASVDTNHFQATITSADAQAATQVKAKTAAKKIHVTDIIISVDTQMSVQLQSDNGTPQVVMEGVYLSADGGFTKTFNPRFPLVVNTNEDLDVITSAAGNISVTITGYVV